MEDAVGSETDPCAKRMKKEKDAFPTAGHSHRFYVKFSPSDHKEHAINCDQARTVLQAIKTCHKYDEQFSDENLVIQLGENDRKYAIATHFPCTCIRKDELLILSHKKEKTEETQCQDEEPIQSEDMYSVFSIETVGGINTRTKPFIRSHAFSRFKYLCVYGEKGRDRTVEDALRRDGRFIDDLGNFTLSDNTDPNKSTGCTQPVKHLHEKEFKLSLEKAQPEKTQLKSNKKAVTEEVKQRINVTLKTMGNNKLSVQDLVDRVKVMNESKGKSGKSGKSGQSGSSVDVEEIYDLLREQYAGLKELMMRRFPGDSYKKTLNMKKKNFGKIQQSFSEVHRVRELITLGESVCKVIVEGYWTGTGFVLFDNFILTNAHLFKDCVEGKENKKLKHDIEVYALFNFEKEHKNYHRFELAHRYICYCHDNLDYAIFQLKPVSHKYNPETTEVTKENVPPGLLERFGPKPKSGEACLIGHPEGRVKQMDPTSIIEIENRVKAVEDQLEPYKDTAFIVHIINEIKNQGIESILVGGNKENVTTYNTFMYHGSSGSPVFDAQCKVFGLHTSGYVYDFPKDTKSVIEYAQPLLTIFAHFVSKLREPGGEELLRRVKEVAKGNPDLENILNPDSDDSDDSMETD
ncbi:protein FAM111A-like [Trematomus bernacchii]|uniref:protein FAM111A-like n=1 Tax=Trematomus bernacchii TaxID=40690 RepID=UPI00146B2A2B|nr:protein FAM111A-like [Trematomus bernacchii]XP_033970225.1 protein FAM111A-like [Trematomus bernacchii]XP_033970226.1 protein FAM111A-like [Trematomus bernacchii]XP_033970227.1 protein FAM111A-like [Trematomus bernacchii]XP_033970228.1 protein FAM111A-like [Trematomus bernacchii]XP_033970229.1 protein FAM111A-like [Trematomus bernacchii]XP_033970230.1 protein FAM111A-like [Trematomus bernacchii]XP_033970231.1 protein FAM111A-like [Trematomus bernacchii]